MAEVGTERPGISLGPKQFIALMAALMTMTAIATDINLPAIAATAADLQAPLSSGQLTITLFFLGYAVGQLFWGPCADRFGRKPALMAGIAIYVASSLACAFAPDMKMLLLARFVQGVGGGAGAIISRVMIRDLFEGAPMARMMSLVLAAFITAPIVAPSIGAMIQKLGSWRLIFIFLVSYGLVLLVLAWRFLPESIRHYQPDALSPSRLVAGYVALAGQRASLSATLVVAFAYAILNVYLTNAPAIFMVAHGMDEQSFAIGFSVVAASSAIGNLANARLCRFMALRSVILIGLCGVLAAALLLLVTDRFFPGSGWALVPGFCILLIFYGFILANATALAMQGHGGMVGAISSSLGVIQTAIAAFFGALAAFLFDGTARPALLTILGCVLLCLATFRWIARQSA